MSVTIDVDSCYRRYAPMVYRRCVTLLGDESLAADAMQDVFVKLLVKHEHLDDRSLSGLLYRIATRVCLNWIRTQKRRPETQSEALLAAIADADDVESTTLARRLIDQLFGQLRGRTQTTTRVMATLHYVDGWTLNEVAKEVGMSVSGVRKRLHSLRSQLRELESSP